MSSQDVMLTWNGHHRTLIDVFEKLLESNSLVDCTIIVEGQRMKAHKEVLCAFSPYFQVLFKEENDENPTVILSGFSFQDLLYIIDFMYHGKVIIHEDKVQSLIDAAQSLAIKGLGGGHKENALGHRHKNVNPNQSYSSKVPHKQKRKISDEDNGFYAESEGNVQNQSFRQAKQQSIIGASQFHPPQSVASKANVDDSLILNNPNGADYSYSIPSSVPFPDSDDDILYPESVVKIELGPDHNTSRNDCSFSQSPKKEVNAEQPSHKSSGNGGEIESEEVDTSLCSDNDLLRRNSFENVPTSFTAPNQILCPDVVIKSEQMAEDEVKIKCEDVNFSGARKETVDVDIELNETRRTVPSGACAITSKGSILGQNTHLQLLYVPVDSSNRGTRSTSMEWVPEAASAIEIRDYQRRQPPRRPPREYSCPQCHKIFRQSCNLKVHMRIHTGERPYKCSECDFAATHISNLKQHQRIHSGERPYKCSECNFAAAGSGDLKKHQRIHSGEKPYKCTECDFAATGSGDLNKHQRIHCKDRPTKGSDFDCSVAGTSDLIHSIPKYFENNYLLKMSHL